MEKAVLNIIRVHIECMKDGVSNDETLRRMAPLRDTLAPYMDMLDETGVDTPEFDYRLLADLCPKGLMATLFFAAAMLYKVTNED